MSISEDIIKAINAIREDESALEIMRREIYSGKKLQWLVDFSNKTVCSYNEWLEVCKLLLGISICPDLQVLNTLNKGIAVKGLSVLGTMKKFLNLI